MYYSKDMTQFAVLHSPDNPQLGPEWHALGNSGYWSTHENIQTEVALAQAVDALQGQSDTLRLPADFLAARRKKFLEEKWAKVDFEEAEDQAKIIFEHMTVPHRFTIITGPPGAAKTTVAANWMRLARGHNTYLPIILITAEKEALSRLQDRLSEAVPDLTLTLEDALKQEKPWPKYSCVLIDEAGLIDTQSMVTLLNQAVEMQAARVILIGDDKQLLPQGMGQPFRWIRENKKAQVIELLYSFRQKTAPLRQAITDFYGGHAEAAFKHIVPSFLMPGTLVSGMQTRIKELPADKTLILYHGNDTLRNELSIAYQGYRVLSLSEAQGLAFDNAVLVIAKQVDLAAMLVGCSRQRYALDVFVDESVYKDKSALLRDLTYWRTQKMALDFLSARELLDVIDEG